MMHIALIDAMYYGEIFIFCLLGLLGISMEMALRDASSKPTK